MNYVLYDFFFFLFLHPFQLETNGTLTSKSADGSIFVKFMPEVYVTLLFFYLFGQIIISCIFVV